MRVTTSRCRGDLWADELTFVGATPPVPRFTRRLASQAPVRIDWLVVPAGAWLLLLGGLAWRRSLTGGWVGGFATLLLVVTIGVTLIVRAQA